MDFYQFISENINTEPHLLALSQKKYHHNFDIDFALVQIQCRRKNASKLSDWINNPKFLFPDLISGEQASHQAIAKFHSSLIPPGLNILDMTAGLGIDALEFAKAAKSVTAIDIINSKTEALKHNAKLFNLNNLNTINNDSVSWLAETTQQFDLIFLDPARRDENNNRVYNLKDCMPDVLKLEKLLLQKSSSVLIKASPLLDITQTIKDFQNISSIYTVGIKGECKEILIELRKTNNDTSSHSPNSNRVPSLKAVDLDNHGNIISYFEITTDDPSFIDREVKYASIDDLKNGAFILQPSSMIMKLAPWQKICDIFNAKKLAPSSHIFVTENIPENFPGRVTKFEKIINKQDRKSLMGLPASIISRNYPVSSDTLRNQLKIAEGDNNFIYATRLGATPLMFLSSKTITG